MREFKDAYAQAGLMGLAIFFAGLAIIFIAIVIYDIGEVLFLLFFVVPGLVVGAALMFWKRWGLLLAILGSVFGMLFLLEDVDLIMTTPKAFFDFAATAFGLAGLAIVLVAAVAGTIQYIRKQPSSALAQMQRSVIMGVAGVLGVLAVISLAITLLNTGDASASDAEGGQRIAAKHTEWSVTMVSASAGDVKLVVKNRDPILHTFTIDDLDVDVRLGPWSEQVIVLEDVQAGTYGFICRVFDHATDMTGVLRVQ